MFDLNGNGKITPDEEAFAFEMLDWLGDDSDDDSDNEFDDDFDDEFSDDFGDDFGDD